MRPRFSLSRFDAIWSFSRWMVLFNIGNRLSEELTLVLLGDQWQAAAPIISAIALALLFGIFETLKAQLPAKLRPKTPRFEGRKI